MARPSVINLNDLYGSDEDELIESENKNQENTEITEVDLSQLSPFSNHKFKLYQGERLNDMVLSIKEYGILTPIILRRLDDDTLQILAGHNRVNAAKIAGIEKINKDSFIIYENLTEAEARAIVRETNIIQRGFTELSYSEKAAVLAERHKDIKEQGRMKDIISEIENIYKADDLEENSDLGRFCPQDNTRDIISNKYDLSPRNVSNYLRIDTLIEELKDRLDIGEIPFTSGVDLSFLKEEEQETIESILDEYGYKIDLKKSDTLKAFSKGRNLNYDKALEILSGDYFEKPKNKKKPKFSSKFTNNIVNKYVTEKRSLKEVEEIAENLLEKYFSNQLQEDNKSVETEEIEGQIDITSI